MARVSTNISLDSKLKKEAKKLLKEIGMDLSTFVTLSLKQMIRDKGVFFDISCQEPNKETIAALKESKDIEKHPNKYKTYNTVDELAKEMNH